MVTARGFHFDFNSFTFVLCCRDGDSTRDPLLASLSGKVTYTNRWKLTCFELMRLFWYLAVCLYIRREIVLFVLGTIQDSPNVFEITASSGAAYLHFYSDAAFTLPGFNISYEVEGCDLDCSSRASHGTCVPLASNGGIKRCNCDKGWMGIEFSVVVKLNYNYSHSRRGLLRLNFYLCRCWLWHTVRMS